MQTPCQLHRQHLIPALAPAKPYPNCQNGSPPNLALRRPTAILYPLSGILPLHRHHPRPRTPQNPEKSPYSQPYPTPRMENSLIRQPQKPPASAVLPPIWYLTPTPSPTPPQNAQKPPKSPQFLPSPSTEDRNTAPEAQSPSLGAQKPK